MLSGRESASRGGWTLLPLDPPPVYRPRIGPCAEEVGSGRGPLYIQLDEALSIHCGMPHDTSRRVEQFNGAHRGIARKLQVVRCGLGPQAEPGVLRAFINGISIGTYGLACIVSGAEPFYPQAGRVGPGLGEGVLCGGSGIAVAVNGPGECPGAGGRAYPKMTASAGYGACLC